MRTNEVFVWRDKESPPYTPKEIQDFLASLSCPVKFVNYKCSTPLKSGLYTVKVKEWLGPTEVVIEILDGPHPIDSQKEKK